MVTTTRPAFADKLPLALHLAKRHARDPHEFDEVEIVAHSFARSYIVDDVFAYAVLLKVGPGDHDLIRLHRVVREKTPSQPIISHRPVFLLHGGTVDFRTTFLGRTVHADADERSLAVFLAQRNLDVWGLDMRWALIPASTTDFAFMQDSALCHRDPRHRYEPGPCALGTHSYWRRWARRVPSPRRE